MRNQWELIQHKLRHFFSRKNASLVVGILYFGLLGAVGFYTIIQGVTEDYEKPYYLPVQLETAENLKDGATVYVLGVPAGRLHSRAFQRKDGRQYVVAVLILKRPVVLYENYSIHSKYMEILGEKVIEINPGYRERLDLVSAQKENAGAEAEGHRRVHESLSLPYITEENAREFRRTEQLPPSVRIHDLPVASNFDDPLYLASVLINENRSGLRRSISNLADITDKLDRSPGTIAKLANSPEIMDGLNETADEAKVLVQVVRDGLEDYRETDSMIDLIEIVLSRALSSAL